MKINYLCKYTFLFVINLLIIYNCSPGPDVNFKGHFSIMVLADIHISNDESKDNRLTDLINTINSGEFNNLEILITTGDNVSSFQLNKNAGDTDKNQRGKKFIKLIDRLKIPYIITLGNHDYKIDSERDSDDPFSKTEIDTMESLWSNIAGLEPYYSQVYRGWNIIVLNSMRGRYLDRFFDDEQMKWFKAELERQMPALVYFHHPIETDNLNNLNMPTDVISSDLEPEFFRIVKKNKDKIKGIFAGHIHRWIEDTIYDTVPVYVTDSFADNELSPYHIIQVDTSSKSINVTNNEFINN